MKVTGIIRKIDSLGRLVIPAELRSVLSIDEGTPIEFLTADEGQIVLRKYQPGCAFCGSVEPDMLAVYKRLVCRACVAGLKREDERN